MSTIIKQIIIDPSAHQNTDLPQSISSGAGETWRNATTVVDHSGRYWIFAWRKNRTGSLGKILFKMSQDDGATFTAWTTVSGVADDGTDDVEQSFIRAVLTPHNTIVLSLVPIESVSGGGPSDTIVNILDDVGYSGVSDRWRRGDNRPGLSPKPLDLDYIPGVGYTYLTKIGLYWENPGTTGAQLGVTYTSDIGNGTTGMQGVTGLGSRGVTGIQGVTGLDGGGSSWAYEWDRAILASNQSISAGSPTLVAFDTLFSGNLGIWDIASSSGIIAVDGIYRVCLQLRIDSGSGGTISMATIDIDGAPVKAVNTNPSAICEFIGFLVAGSVITATVLASVGGVILVSGQIECNITVEKFT
jgi:hypothetical protein